MTEMTNGLAETMPAKSHATKAVPRKKRAKAAQAATSKRKKPKKSASAASSRPASGRKKKRAPGGKMAKAGRYVLVIHMAKATQAALDRAIKKSGDSRSSYCRAVVERALKIKHAG